jgi:hypothetical protein
MTAPICNPSPQPSSISANAQKYGASWTTPLAEPLLATLSLSSASSQITPASDSPNANSHPAFYRSHSAPAAP